MQNPKHLFTNDGEIVCVYRAKVYLSGDNESIRNLAERGFTVRHWEFEDADRLFDECIAKEVFEVHALQRTGVGKFNWDWDVVLIKDYYFDYSLTSDFIDATILFDLHYVLLTDFCIKTKLLTTGGLLHICEMLLEHGHDDIVDIILKENPVLGYAADKKKYDKYISQQVNKNKTLNDFIEYCEGLMKSKKTKR